MNQRTANTFYSILFIQHYNYNLIRSSFLDSISMCSNPWIIDNELWMNVHFAKWISNTTNTYYRNITISITSPYP